MNSTNSMPATVRLTNINGIEVNDSNVMAFDFVEHVNEDLKEIKNKFFLIGFRLAEANRMKYYEQLGYESLEALSEDLFGIKKSSAYNLINIYERCAISNSKMQMLPYYEQFNQSQLVEILACKTWPEQFKNAIKPTDSVSKIRKARQAFEFLLREDKTFFKNGYVQSWDSELEEYFNEKPYILDTSDKIIKAYEYIINKNSSRLENLDNEPLFVQGGGPSGSDFEDDEPINVEEALNGLDAEKKFIEALKTFFEENNIICFKSSNSKSSKRTSTKIFDLFASFLKGV